MTASSPQQAVANGRAVSTYPQGYCQKFVRAQCWQVPSLYGSAIEAWNGAKFKHPGDRNAPLGAPMYYRGGQYGHAVISTNDSTGMRSTDCTTATRVSDTDVGWPERAWGYQYLGWTEDINGVRVIKPDDEEDDDMPLSEDDLQKIAKRVNQALGDYDAKGKPEEGKEGDYADQRFRQIESKLDKILNKLG